MGVLSKIGQVFSFQKKATARFVDFLYGSSADFPESNFVRHVTDGYCKNEIVFACVSKRAKSVAQAPVMVVDKDGVEHPSDHTRLLFNKPNEFHTESQIWQKVVTFFMLSGNAFVLKVRSSSGRVVQLWPIRPDLVRIVPARSLTKFISHYLVRVNGVEYPVKTEDICHFKTMHPANEFFGMPEVQPILRQYVTDNEATKLVMWFLKNRATPGLAVETEAEEMDEAKADRLRQKWNERFLGEGNGGVVFLRKGMKVTPIGLNMRDLRFPELSGISETRICAALDTPPIIINLKSGIDRGTFTNYGQARAHYWEETIVPMLQFFAARLNLDPDLGRDRDGKVVFDLREVTALLGVRERRATLASQLFTAGLARKNEARELAGLRPDAEDGDKFVETIKTDVPSGDVAPRGADFVERERSEADALA